MLTKKMQIQAIADRLAGMETTLKARNLSEPWRTCWQALDEVPPEQGRQALVLAMQEHPERDAILGAIFSAQPGAPLGHFPSLQEMHDAGMIPPIEWLWPDWIPLGMLSLLTGEGGAGKSMLALDLANRITAGTPFPDGAPVPRPGAPVVYVEAEAVPQLHDQRTEWWQSDRSKLHLMLPGPDELFIDLNEPACRDRLVEMVTTVNPALVVVDSLSTISLKGENNKEDVVQLLGFLSRVANGFNIGLLLIHHLRKRVGGQLSFGLTQDDVRGSGHIVAAARSVLGLSLVQTGPETDKNGPRRLEMLKTNLSRYPKPIGCQLVPLHPQGVYWKYGEAPERYRAPTKVDACADWLLATLQEHGEPVKPKDLVELAAEEGYGRAILYKARKLLEGQVVNTAGRKNPDNRWALAKGEEG
jgi:hypothetical protein